VGMSLLRSAASGLRSLFRKHRADGELDEDLRGLLEMAAEEKMKYGMSRKETLRRVCCARILASQQPPWWQLISKRRNQRWSFFGLNGAALRLLPIPRLNRW
jgi:hypothetical protein